MPKIRPYGRIFSRQPRSCEPPGRWRTSTYIRLLAITADSPEERADFERKLREYTWALKVNSVAGTTFMKHALAMIESSTHVQLSTSGEGWTNTSSVTALSMADSDTWTRSAMSGVGPRDDEQSSHDVEHLDVNSVVGRGIDEWDLDMDTDCQGWGD